jgi:trehalose 6-phosphate phosphatase
MSAFMGREIPPDPLNGRPVDVFPAQDLSRSFETLREPVSKASHIGLFLDFDGTIAPIVSTPSSAKLDPTVRTLLEQLKGLPNITVGVVSGRLLQDLRSRTAIDGLIYVGNHGLEIEAGEIRFREPAAEALRRELKCVSLQLKLALDGVDGLEVEDKGLTLSVHYRKVHEDMQDWVRDIALETAGKYQSFRSQEGKKVVEIRPRLDWDKGRAMRWLLKEVLPPSALPIYIGDDATDEDVFGAIPQGITIRVGGVPATGTRAHFVLPDVQAVARFLSWLTHAKPNASAANAQWAGK